MDIYTTSMENMNIKLFGVARCTRSVYVKADIIRQYKKQLLNYINSMFRIF